jgi:anti-anti-sigma factor
MLSIDVEKTGHVAVARCVGRLVRGEAVRTLKNAVVSERNTRIIVLDLSDVEAIDAGGLSGLISLQEWTLTRGIQLKLVNPSHFVREVLEKTGLDRVFEITSLHDALVVLVDPRHATSHHTAYC